MVLLWSCGLVLLRAPARWSCGMSAVAELRRPSRLHGSGALGRSESAESFSEYHRAHEHQDDRQHDVVVVLQHRAQPLERGA